MRLTKGFCSCLCSYCLWDGKEGQFLHHQKNKPGLAEQRVGDAWLLSYWVGEISILSAVSPLERSPLAPEGFCRLTCGSWPAREEGQWMAEWEWHQGMGSGEPGEGFHSCCCWSKGHWCALKDGIVLRGTSCGCSTVLDAGLFLYAQAHWRPGVVKHYVCYSSCCMWQSPLRSMKPQRGAVGSHICVSYQISERHVVRRCKSGHMVVVSMGIPRGTPVPARVPARGDAPALTSGARQHQVFTVWFLESQAHSPFNYSVSQACQWQAPSEMLKNVFITANRGLSRLLVTVFSTVNM